MFLRVVLQTKLKVNKVSKWTDPSLIYSFDLTHLIEESENFRVHFTLGLFLSIEIIMIRNCSCGQKDLNSVFNDEISCGYIRCNAGNWIKLIWWNNQIQSNPLLTLTSDLLLLWAQRKQYFLLSGCLGDQKFWFLSGLCSWGLRNTESCSVGDQIFRVISWVLWGIRISDSGLTCMCSLGDQEFWILSHVFVGDQKFSILSCLLTLLTLWRNFLRQEIPKINCILTRG